MNIYGVAVDAILQCFFLDRKLTMDGLDPMDNAPAPLVKWFEKHMTEE